MAEGISAYAAHVPAHALGTTTFGPLAEAAPRRARSVAGFDEDAVTLAVAAGGQFDALSGPLVFGTSEPPYLDKSSAATVHAALELDRHGLAFDLAGLRAGAAALSTALRAGGSAVSADLRTPAPGAADELGHGDGAAAFACGGEAAVLLGSASTTVELLDRWRLPGERHATAWDERFTAETLTGLLIDAGVRALAAAGLERADHVVVACPNPRAARAARVKLGGDGADAQLEALIGHAGAAQLGLLLADAFDRTAVGETVLAVCGADGADAFLFRVEAPLVRGGPSVREQVAARSLVTYDRYLRWRGILELRGFARPDPQAPAAPPMLRRGEWKYALVGERCTACGSFATPPGRVCPSCGAVDTLVPEPLRGLVGKIVSFTTDHLAPSVDPPVVLAVVDLENGARRSVEVTDVNGGVHVGTRVVPTFRRIFTSEGVHNYFWKVRPV